MLSYLVTSKTRRRLLELLWKREATGTASELARDARVSFAGAYRELKAMEAAGLARMRVEDGDEIYAAALDHPDADLVRRLVDARLSSSAPADPAAAQLRGQTRSLGAPLQVPAEAVDPEQREQVMVDAVGLARRDATLARVLPIAIWHQRDQLDRDRLESAAHRARQKHALGFLLALTATLAGDEALHTWAESLRDHRVRTLRPFFDLPSSRRNTRAHAPRTPAIARAWGYSMDLDLASFQTMFDKHAADV